MQVVYIYCVVNLLNDKKYVGQTKYLPQKRFSGHCADAKTRNMRRGLARAIKKHGPESFVVEQLCSATSREEANALERKLIKFFDCLTNGYNMLSGGAGNRTKGNPHTKTPEWRTKISEIRKRLWADPEKRQKMIDGRWKNRPKRGQYCPPRLSKEKRAEAIARSNRKRAKVFSFTSPDGNVFVVNGLPDFCRQNNLNPTCMCRVANGTYLRHKGWTAA